MGLLSQGQPLDWEETSKYAKYVCGRGIAQFINIYNHSKDRADACFKWGDEVSISFLIFITSSFQLQSNMSLSLDHPLILLSKTLFL